MIKLLKALGWMVLGFFLYFYLIELPKQVLNNHKMIMHIMDVDTLQTSRILKLIDNNNAFVDYLKKQKKNE